MWTKEYKGFYIHGYCNKPQCSITFENGEPLINVKSLQAAKLAITKFLGMCSINGNKFTTA